MFRFLRATVSIALFSYLGTQLPAQGLNKLPPDSASKRATSSTPADPLHRTTPRETIYRFLEACHKGKLTTAAQYLDLRKLPPEKRAREGPQLAELLGKLLDRNSRFEVSSLSDSPEGNTVDGQTPGIDELATFELNGEPVTLQLQRVTEPQTGPIWIVSADSVAQIPALSALIVDNGIEKHLPAPLVNIMLIGTPLWAWLALLLIGMVLSAISRLLSRLFIALLKPITKRYAKSFHTHRLGTLTEPLRLVLSVIVFRAVMAFVPTSALLRDDLVKVLALLFVLGSASLLMRLVDVFSDTVTSRLDHRERALTYSVFPLGIRIIKILIFCFAAVIVLQQWGYNTSTILAGIGVGGIAVALAAQKTIENLFGGVSLISDRPVLVGDFCQFGGQVGTVEDIGLRSTRIRTLDRTLVTVPNSQFSTMTLENFSKRDRIWFHPTIRLRRDTSPDQVRQMMAAITDILTKNESIDASGVPLRFSKITDSSLDLDIFAYVLTPDYNEYLKVQTNVLLQILEASYRLNIGLTVPFQEEYNVAVDSRDAQTAHPFLAFARSRDGADVSGNGVPAGVEADGKPG